MPSILSGEVRITGVDVGPALLESGSPLGLGMAAGVCAGFAAGLGERTLSLESAWLPAAGGALLTVLAGGVTLIGAHLVGLAPQPLAGAARAVLGSACYNGVIAVPIFHGLRGLDTAVVRLYERSRPA